MEESFKQVARDEDNDSLSRSSLSTHCSDFDVPIAALRPFLADVDKGVSGLGERICSGDCCCNSGFRGECGDETVAIMFSYPDSTNFSGVALVFGDGCFEREAALFLLFIDLFPFVSASENSDSITKDGLRLRLFRGGPSSDLGAISFKRNVTL